MQNILYIDATINKDSRTRKLADYLLSKFEANINHINLYDIEIPNLSDEKLNWRMKCCEEDNFEDEYFSFAKQFANADIIVVAAPFWDMSFPSILKQYIETISIYGITFKYLENGDSIGLCKAKKFYYITTAGGYIENNAFGYGYIYELFHNLYGIKDASYIKAEGLDLFDADINMILENAYKDIDSLLNDEVRLA